MPKQVDDLVLQGPDQPAAAFIAFNISLAKDADSAAVERLVQEVAMGVGARCAERNMTLTDALCVAEELLARFMVTAAALQAKDKAEVEAWFDSIVNLVYARAVELLHGQPPGVEPKVQQ